MPENGTRSTYSQCPFQVLTFNEDDLIGSASGFFYEHDQEWFLITNWHVLSGIGFPQNNNSLDSCRPPTHIKIKLSSYEIDGFPIDEEKYAVVAQKVHIYENDQPLWFEHPTLGHYCDVVALPFQRPSNCPEFMHNAANRISELRTPIEPGCTVFVIGFPRSLSVGYGLPIWKSGYIASEPFYDVTINGRLSELGGLDGGVNLPAFFIDSLTREGMSGSPVFSQYIGTWDMSNPYKTLDFDSPGFWGSGNIALGSRGIEFAGCYSGRVGDMNADQAALGLCWRESTIIDVCSGRKPGKHPNDILLQYA